MPATPRSVTKTEAAFRALRQAIEDGRYHPGEHLRVAQLIDELDMSPTPIREALRLLQAEGLIVHHPHRGMAVAEYSPEDAEEVYRLRALLEPMATEQTVLEASDEQIAEMRRLHDELAAALADESRTDTAELNAAWHRAVYSANGSRHLQDIISRLWQAIPMRAVWLTGRGSLSVAQHERIMSAIEHRDAAAAAACMREHIELGALSTVEHLRTLGRVVGPPA
jgi:DNA-binding GntR family transcriptional regulator